MSGSVSTESESTAEDPLLDSASSTNIHNLDYYTDNTLTDLVLNSHTRSLSFLSLKSIQELVITVEDSQLQIVLLRSAGVHVDELLAKRDLAVKLVGHKLEKCLASLK